MLVLTAGLTFSYALITQPRVAIMLPFAAAWLATALPWRFAIRLVLIALLLPAVWIARDYALYEEFIPISLGGPASLYQDNVDPLTADGFAAAALAAADAVCVTDVYPARERPLPGVTGKLIVERLCELRPGMLVAWAPAVDTGAALLAGQARPGDLLLTVGAGDIDRAGPAILATLSS